MSLSVLYEDNHLLAVVKPAGLLTQGDATGDVTLTDLCKAYLKEKYDKPGDVFLGLVHRLDRPVSGAMMLARTGKAAARLSEQFRNRSPEKIYHAVVEGFAVQAEATLVHWIALGGGTRRKVTAHIRETPNTKRAELSYRVLGTAGGRSLLEIRLLSGVKHQIRAQLSASGCPVVGDVKYDNRRPPHRAESLDGGRAIALHARRLTVEHPTRHEPVMVEAPYPSYWPWRHD